MMNGGTAPAEPTVDSLQADLERLRRVLELCRQQRDQFAGLANDLQVELALAREREQASTRTPAAEILPPEEHPP